MLIALQVSDTCRLIDLRNRRKSLTRTTPDGACRSFVKHTMHFPFTSIEEFVERYYPGCSYTMLSVSRDMTTIAPITKDSHPELYI